MVQEPAIIKSDSSKEWLIDGKHIRDDGPAIEQADGTKCWTNAAGEFHRDNDEPAITGPDREEWFINGKHGRVENKDCPSVIIKGIKHYYKDGKLHRVGAPTIIYPDGSQEWYFEGKLHRPGGLPAKTILTATTCVEEWLIDGEHCRADGPAIKTTHINA